MNDGEYYEPTEAEKEYARKIVERAKIAGETQRNQINELFERLEAEIKKSGLLYQLYKGVNFDEVHNYDGSVMCCIPRSFYFNLTI